MFKPTLMGGVLLVYLLVLLPWLAYRSALRMRAARSGTTVPGAEPLPPLTGILAGTLIMLIALFLLAWLTGRGYQFNVFWFETIGGREIAAGVAALAGYFVLRLLSRALRTPEERRTMAVRQLMPRTRKEWTLYLAVGLAAGIAEESAYRGVGMYALTLVTGNPWVAALGMSLAFALAHITQEWKSAGIVFVMALLTHALVVVTNTLVVAMVVHVVYDWLAALLLAREMRVEEAGATAG